MSLRDGLGNRIKHNYENISKTRLVRRMPVAIRLDGKTFHSFTIGLKRPYDKVLAKTMQNTMKYLCENIQGCVFGYTQSDEITLILLDYQKFNTDAWFDYEIQKLCSVSASMATMAFNKFFFQEYEEINKYKTADEVYLNTLHNKIGNATFDSRCFNIPKEEVANLIYWRQLDATRNSIQMLGQTYFSHSELQNKTCSQIQDMLMKKYNMNWNDCPAWFKRGSCCIRNYKIKGLPFGNGLVAPELAEGAWFIDRRIPIFRGEEGRNYIEQFIFIGEE